MITPPKTPLRITIDAEGRTPLVYVYYVPDEDAIQPESYRIGDSLVVDVKNGNIVGLELLDLNADTIAAAIKAAGRFGALFPAYLGGPPAELFTLTEVRRSMTELYDIVGHEAVTGEGGVPIHQRSQK